MKKNTKKSQKKGKVLVGMSGGLDSTVAAALLKEQGYDVVGLYLNVWADPTLFDSKDREKFPQNKCCSIESLMLARRMCQKLEIPFYSYNVEEKFKEKVVDFFLDGHRAGETPNPCVRCNKTIKFGAMFQKMQDLGCDFLATGHYVKIKQEKNGRLSLHCGRDDSKDQSYFLYHLSQDQLKNLLFPLGDFNKSEIRAMARERGLIEVSEKRESQGVCFYPEKTYMPFLKRYLKQEADFSAGEIENQKGEVLGEHQGLPFYTIGQRKGIGVGGGSALFVNKMDQIRNVLIVGSEEELQNREVEIRDVSFISGETPGKNEILQIRVRSHGKFNRGQVRKEKGKVFVRFETLERALAAGQSLVFYRDTELIGGGILTWNKR